MRTVKRTAFLSGLCGVAVALGLWAADARAQDSQTFKVTTERGASILAFPKVLADGTADTIIQIGNTSNNMVHARCYYVDAQLAFPDLPPGPTNRPIWQETDFTIWLTKQQPTHWLVSEGRLVDATDSCSWNNQIDPDQCDTAGIDPGAVPPVQDGFVGELKCIEVDVSDTPLGGNHLKGEATIKYGIDVAKYNAIGFEGTDLVSEDNELRLDQPWNTDEVVGEYAACPNVLILNHLAEGVTDPVILQHLQGGVCADDGAQETGFDLQDGTPCQSDADCCVMNGGGPGECVETCENGPRILDGSGDLALRSATLTDLTLVPCSQDFENQIPGRVTVQFRVFNEFEQAFSASTTVDCWGNFFLYEINSPKNPENSPFHYANLGTTVAQTRITPVGSDGGVIGVGGVVRADRSSRIARTLLNLHMEGDRLSATEGAVVDQVILSDR